MSAGPFDYVVIGGGSAGCIVAAELSACGAYRVLLLERGPPADDHPETLRADGYKDAFANDAVIHERFSVPQPRCGDQRVFLGSGSVLGGSGAVNGMVYLRGAREDFAEWPEGWRWADVVPAFEAIETKLRIHQRAPTAWTEACVEAAESCGFRRRADLNDGDLSNAIGYEWMSYEGARRRSSYVAFLREAPERPSLTVVTGARVDRVVLDTERRVRAVEYRVGEERRRAGVTREAVLCAGALETPKLLMLSGIGPAEHLRFAGIPVVHASPEVGCNLHDHPNVPVFFRGSREVDCHYPQLYSFFRVGPGKHLAPGQSDTCFVYWPARSAMKEATARMLPAQVLPPSLYQSWVKGAMRSGIGLAFRPAAVRRFVDRLFAIVVILGKPTSRGSLRLHSRDPGEPALLDPGYYTDPDDLETMVRGVSLARELAAAPGLAHWGAKALMPRAGVRGREAIAAWVRSNTITTYHYAGTCRMGTDARAVVDPQLRVRGVRGLRVADASVIPTTPVSALNAPSMLVGYRAAQWIRAGAESRAD